MVPRCIGIEIINFSYRSNNVGKGTNLEMETLRNEIARLSQELQEAKHTVKKYEGALAKAFTPGQTRKLMNVEKQNVRWTSEDFAAAISLRSVSAKAYRYLRAHNFPLPALSTLRSWI